MKVCKDCQTKKELDKFYKHLKMQDGHLNKCIECVKKRVKQYSILNSEKIKEYQKKISILSSTKAKRKKYIQSEKGKIAQKKASIVYRQNYPLKYAARVITQNALRNGKLIKHDSCSMCQSTTKIEGHHDDYTKPLELRWLCENCHKNWHKHNKAIYS